MRCPESQARVLGVIGFRVLGLIGLRAVRVIGFIFQGGRV